MTFLEFPFDPFTKIPPPSKKAYSGLKAAALTQYEALRLGEGNECARARPSSGNSLDLSREDRQRKETGKRAVYPS